MATKIIDMTDEELFKTKTSYVLYTNYYEDYVEGCSFEEIGKLFYCITFYERFRIEPDYPDRETERLFKKIKNNLDSTDKDWITELRIRSLKGSKHTGNQYTRRKEKEEYLEQLAQQALEQNGTEWNTVPNNNENGTLFQKDEKNGTDGTVTVTDTETVTVLEASVLNEPRFSAKADSEELEIALQELEKQFSEEKVLSINEAAELAWK